MTTEFDTNLPSIRQVQSMIKEKNPVEIKLLTGELIAGTLRWQDPSCLCVEDEGNQPTLIWRQAIAYLKPKG
jgi:host factor-I protein